LASRGTDFTPWLAENIDLLSEVLGLPLEVVEREAEIGSFRADLVCKVTDDGPQQLVIVENQLERTNHDHLGKIITYGAGREAATIVWIAREFTEEHRNAIEWLNRVTQDHINFFALEIELWRVGHSEPAPKLNVVCEPNDWRVIIQRPGRGKSTQNQQARLEFWTAFKEFLATSSKMRAGKPRSGNVMPFSIGKGGFELIATANTWNEETRRTESNIQVQLTLSRQNSNDDFARLLAQKTEIERRLGCALVWNNPSLETRLKRMYVRQVTDFSRPELWPAQHAWLNQHLTKFKEVFGPLVGEL